MNHPNREEWIPFLAGEASPAAGRRLAEHLEACPECAAEVAAWQRAEQRLGAWELPRLPERAGARVVDLFPVFKWAVAAALVLGAGFGLGRLTVPPAPDPGLADTQLKELRQTLRRDLAQDVQTSLARAQNESSNALAALEFRLTQTAALENRRLVQAVSDLLGRARAEDRSAVLALFRELEQQHLAAYVALRKDLETVASFTDDELRFARRQLGQLAANAPAAENH